MTRKILAGTLLALLACGDSADSASLEASGGVFDSPERDGTSSGGSAGAGAPNEPAPEIEIESSYEAPVATGNLLWIANPKSGRVALVDAVTLRVRTIEAGNEPTYLASVPGQPTNTTLVLNVASEDATLLRVNADGSISSKQIKTAKRANAMAFSKDGRFAIAWADAKKVKGILPKTEGLQDLTILDLVNGTSTILAVGYRPVTVGFIDGAARAYAVTQDGVALLDLSGSPRVFKNVPISATPTEDPGTRDVFVSKDGLRAFIRRDGSDQITVVALDSDAPPTLITLTGPVTDLDIDDTGNRAIAVVRSTAEVALLPVADIASVSSVTVTGETIGSVAIAPGGSRALLYTNAFAIERFSVLDVATRGVRTIKLYSPVLGIFSTPDAQHAVVLHAATAGEGGSPGAFSLAPIGENLPAKIVGTQAPPTAVAVTNDRAVVAERNDRANIHGAWLARMPQLMAERYPLASPPIAVGILPDARRAYIAQLHPEGRLTFVDLESGIARTLTGFELSSRVVDGSKP
jgi:hypothetical protein